MSGIVSGADKIAAAGLEPLAPGLDRAFLVEEFNRILVTHIDLPGFERGIAVFEEKGDLYPFEEAKLYGHNSTHALIGYLLKLKKAGFISDAIMEKGLLKYARDALVNEAGEALCRRYPGVDPMFTQSGFVTYADSLLMRMMNPHLRDSVERVTRDPKRKLGWNDRLIGTIRLALEEQVVPRNFATGAAAAAWALAQEDPRPVETVLAELWKQENAAEPEIKKIMDMIKTAAQSLNGKCQQCFKAQSPDQLGI